VGKTRVSKALQIISCKIILEYEVKWSLCSLWAEWGGGEDFMDILLLPFLISLLVSAVLSA
jgi:hypothetical protein